MSALGILDSSHDTLLNMMKDLGIDTNDQKSVIEKIMNVAVRCTYYVFCQGNKTWTNSDLLNLQVLYCNWFFVVVDCTDLLDFVSFYICTLLYVV